MIITLGAVEYKYKLMFEDRSISVLSYNLETLLAEKMQTILARGLANTRMRDFYDVYEIMGCIHFCKKKFFFAFNGNMMFFTLSVNMM